MTTPAVRKAILALRDDPQLQAVMAAERMTRERVVLEAGLGRRAIAADLYVLHLLGPAGALDFLTESAKEPTTPSAEVARANAGLFVRDGRVLSVSEACDGIAATLRRQADQYGALVAAEG